MNMTNNSMRSRNPMQRALIESPVLGSPREIHWLHGQEALGELFEYHVIIPLEHPTALRGREAELLQHPFTLLFEDGGEIVARVHGITREVKIRVSPNQKTGAAELWIVPRIWTLTQSRQNQIFLDRTLPEIIAEKLTAAGFEEATDFVLALQDRYPAREFVVQYRESDLDFITRLCEHAGVTLFFDHDTGRDRIVFTDGGDAYEAAKIPGGTIRYEPEDDRHAAFEVVETFRRVSERVLVHDYNYRSPQVGLEATARTERPVSQGVLVEYGDHAKTPEEMARVARIRAEEIASRQRAIEAKTRHLVLRAGSLFMLEDAAGTEQRLLVTRLDVRSHHEGNSALSAVSEEKAWQNHVTAIPANIPFRPARRTPKPRVDGLVHAVIDGAIRGPYAEIDEQGRYRVQFNHDLSGRPGLRATHSIRMMQPHAGPRYGMHFPLRVGTEVLIGFVEGDPDRPVIVGTVPNPVTPSPVEQANRTHNVLRTGSGNEMVLDDVVGQERIRIHTPNQNTTIQLGYIDEPELGALLVTDANITEAAGASINESTVRKVEISQTSSTITGDISVHVAGVPAIKRAVEGGMQCFPAVSAQQDAILADLERIGRDPGAFVGSYTAPPPGEAPSDMYGIWSDLGESLADAAREACMAAVRSIAETSDTNLQESIGRRQGEPLGQPDAPALVHASSETAALVGRSRTLVYGERTATVSSFGTVSLVGGKTAELKSPGTVEVAGANETLVTSAGTLDLASRLFRVVAGYYPEKEAPDLDDGTSIGVMARRDIRLTSIEHCIHLCAHKDLNAAAHSGSMRMKAQKQVSIQGGSVSVSGGWVSINSGGDVIVKAGANLKAAAGADVSIEAGGTATIKGATVIIEGGTITLNGPVTVNGDLTVTGALNGG